MVAETKKRLHGSGVGSEGAWRVGRTSRSRGVGGCSRKDTKSSDRQETHGMIG